MNIFTIQATTNPACHSRKQQRLAAADMQHMASNEAFLMSQPELRALDVAKYKKTSGLYDAGQVPFEDLLARTPQPIGCL